jgi:predicted Zn-dependent peptidase
MSHFSISLNCYKFRDTITAIMMFYTGCFTKTQNQGAVMRNRTVCILSIVFILLPILFCSKTQVVKSGDYTYETVKGDPLKARIYTLSNGMKVYMTVYKDAPRIQTCIPVRVGSKNDPAETTGLAHYLEHLLFKGTDEFGTSDFKQEHVLLDSITALYEKYRTHTDSAKRASIYQEIDQVSYRASKFAIANEYDKMLAVIGARGTNAFTSNDLTCYVNDIPANQIKRWLKIESERFQDPVFRLFHTELEVVYEEKNRSMDNDNRKKWEALSSGLWPTHPYGTQTTLGKPEHLKNPSIKNVYDYFHTWYVPNNMALCLSGDFDPDSMIVMIDNTFGKLKSKELPSLELPREQPIAAPVEKEVLGPDMESVMIGFRFPGVKSKEAELLLVTDWLMMNGVAGIIDLNLMQKQLVIEPYSGTNILTDYSAHIFGARPREGQTLEEVRDLLLAQIDSLKAGAFPDWLPGAAVKNLKLNEIRQYESNSGRAFALVDAFINQQKWEDLVHKWEFRDRISKQDIIDFANQYYGNNYVVVYKKTGEDPNVVKIQKPPITPIELNRGTQSAFLNTVETMEAPEIQPVFLDFERDVDHLALNEGVGILYKPNTENDLFTMTVLLDIGKNHNKRLGTALEYLTYLGTSKYSPEAFKQELYKLGCSFNAWASDDQLRINLSGLAETYEEGLHLIEQLLADAQPNQEALQNLVTDILKKRADAKLNKGTILWDAMYSYGVYGKDSPYQNIVLESELNTLTPEMLIDLIRQIPNYPHRILYYGPLEKEQLTGLLDQYHKVLESFQSMPAEKDFRQLATAENRVVVCDYDMKQAEIIMLSKSVPYNRDNVAVRTLFNEYYGGNMSSVVFQTLRESKALAYSVWGSYQTPDRPENAHYIQSYIGTQADKIGEALDGMFNLLNHLAKSDNALADSKNAIIKQIQTERITKQAVLWRYVDAKRMGNDDKDYRIDVYQQVPELTMNDISEFFDEYIKDKKYTILVLGDVDKLNFTILKKYGDVAQLDLEEVFGY